MLEEELSDNNNMTQRYPSKRTLISLVLLIVAAFGIYGLLPQLTHFSQIRQLVQTAQEGWLLVALAMIGGSYIATTMVYQLLSFRRLSVDKTLTVQLAGLLINRIFPAGLGGLGLNFLYLRANKHTVAQATTVVAINNSLGFIGHMLLLVTVLTLLKPAIAPGVSWHPPTLVTLLITAAIVIGAAAFLHWHPTWRRQLIKQARALLDYYKRRPGQLLGALLVSCCLTALTVTSLWAVAVALQVTISLGSVFLIFTFGIAAGTAIPSPGGLGPTEAALAAGFVAYGITTPEAIAVVLVYRGLSFWLGLPIGALATIAMRHQRLLR